MGTVPTGINAAGQIVGHYNNAFSAANPSGPFTGHDHGFVYSNDSYVTLDAPSGAGSTILTGINDAGQIVGYYANSTGFLYSGGSFTILSDPLGVGGTSPMGINAAGQVVGDYSGGSTTHGFVATPTAVTPIVINSISDLQAIQNNLSGYYVLGADIDAAGFNFASIGTASNPFTGIFDGQGHTISNLTINNLSDQAGLFGIIGAIGTVRNVGLINELLTSHFDVGGLAGENFGTVSQSYVTGNVSGVSYVGALVGVNDPSGSITQSFATAQANGGGGGADIGGLVGINQGAITYSYATGEVTFSGLGAGGLVGINSGGSITQSYAIGLIYGSGFAAGGLVGGGAGNVTVSDWDTQTAGRSTSAGGTGLTTAQLQSGILPDGFDPMIWFATAGHFPELSWRVTSPPANQPPVIDAAHSTLTATVNELPLVTGSSTIDYANGANAATPSGVLVFSDPDASDRPTASIDTTHQTVTYQDLAGILFLVTPPRRLPHSTLRSQSRLRRAIRTRAISIGLIASSIKVWISSVLARASPSPPRSSLMTTMEGRLLRTLW